MSLLGQKMKVTLELEDGTYYELDALSTEISQRCDLVDVTEFSGYKACLPAQKEIEMSFRGIGDVSTGLKRTMVVCVACGSEWHDAVYHPGTCANCGWGAGDTKREVDKR